MYHGGPHELGQNFLSDPAAISTIERLVADTSGPILEIGAGDGALTRPLARLGRPVTALELDPARARRLTARAPANVSIHCADILHYRLPQSPHVIVGNIPFHLTTPIIRRLLSERHWHTAVLLVQWEVARRRAAVGGASMLTAAWWPWYDFELHGRIPARAFRPAPSVDGGLLVMRRRGTPLVQHRDRDAYQAFVKEIFTGPGRGLAAIVDRTGRVRSVDLHLWLRDTGPRPTALPKDVTAEQWATLWAIAAAQRSRTAPRSRPEAGPHLGTVPPRRRRP
jgi:23S rRNA (adenine-N6)-dimethyltransferase